MSPTLRKTQAVLVTRTSVPTEDDDVDYVVYEEVDFLARLAVYVRSDMRQEMGSPEQISVTIEPGNTLG